MKTRYAASLFLFFVFLACGKDKFQTIPQLKYKSKNTDVVPVNGNLRVTLVYTDKEGDVSDSLIIVRNRLNKRGPVVLPPSPYKIPSFPNAIKGEFEVDFRYNFDLVVGLTPIRITGSNPIRYEPDTMALKFVARDKAGNKSDTASTEVIVNRQ